MPPASAQQPSPAAKSCHVSTVWACVSSTDHRSRRPRHRKTKERGGLAETAIGASIMLQYYSSSNDDQTVHLKGPFGVGQEQMKRPRVQRPRGCDHQYHHQARLNSLERVTSSSQASHAVDCYASFSCWQVRGLSHKSAFGGEGSKVGSPKMLGSNM